MVLLGEHVADSRIYYYGNYRFHFRSSWSERVLTDSLHDMNVVEDEDRITVRQKMASKCGFTGVSILNRLNHLPYKFNILTDMVFDTMHTLILRIVLRHLQFYQEQGILKNQLIEKRLRKMPWTAG